MRLTSRRGEAVNTAKLTADQVSRIKAEQRRYFWGQDRALARVYGVGPEAINRIRVGRTWRHVEPADPVED